MTRTPLSLFDTTLRDGQQTQGVQFSTPEKIRIAKALGRSGPWLYRGRLAGREPDGLGVFRRRAADPRDDDGLWDDQTLRPFGRK